MIHRDEYLNKLLSYKNQDFVKVITGVRRCGKSSLLILFKEYLLEDGVDQQHIIQINYEKYEMQKYTTMDALHTYIKKQIKDENTYYVCIDEVQEIEEWAKVINSIRASYPVDVYVTGSNSRMFSGEYLTYLSGRYIELKMYPLSFKEFLRFKSYGEHHNLSKYFQEYIEYGSFPAISLVQDKNLMHTILSGLFDSIFTRDVILRGKIRDEGAFLKVAKFVFENIGSPLSANSIANTMKSLGHRISVDTIDNYLKLMCNAYLLYQCERYDIRGKERLKTNGKYYVIDSGLRNQLLGFHTGNYGHMIENLVYIELIRRGYEVYIGKNQKQEVDFIARNAQGIHYIQVSLTILDENTRKREISAFMNIPDHYPRYLISMDDMDFSENGILHMHLLDFLLGREL